MKFQTCHMKLMRFNVEESGLVENTTKVKMNEEVTARNKNVSTKSPISVNNEVFLSL